MSDDGTKIVCGATVPGEDGRLARRRGSAVDTATRQAANDHADAGFAESWRHRDLVNAHRFEFVDPFLVGQQTRRPGIPHLPSAPTSFAGFHARCPRRRSAPAHRRRSARRDAAVWSRDRQAVVAAGGNLAERVDSESQIQGGGKEGFELRPGQAARTRRRLIADGGPCLFDDDLRRDPSG